MNSLEDEGTAELVTGNFPALQKLDLAENFMSLEGAAALADANFPDLQKLCLSRNYLGTAGAFALTQASGPTSRVSTSLPARFTAETRQHSGRRPMPGGLTLARWICGRWRRRRRLETRRRISLASISRTSALGVCLCRRLRQPRGLGPLTNNACPFFKGLASTICTEAFSHQSNIKVKFRRED